MLTNICLGIIFISVTAACPNTQIPPCSCTPSQQTSPVITCTSADNIESLEISLENFFETPANLLEFYESALPYFPEDMFKGFKFIGLKLVTSSFDSLSDTDIAFHGLEETLKYLAIEKCDFLQDLDWIQFRNLKNLTEVIIMESPLGDIDDIHILRHTNLRKLWLNDAHISYISNSAFYNLSNLVSLSLSKNSIEEVTRHMLPNKAGHLEEIILDHNKISNLPPDLFNNMPKLVTVVLAANQLLTMPEATFAPVWHQLKKIDMTGNPLHCNCRMLWIIHSKFPAHTWGECAEPPHVMNKEVTKLIKADLWC